MTSNSPAVRAAIAELKQQALATGRAHEPITVDVNKDGTVANITIPIDGSGTDAESRASLADLREIVPATVGAVPGTEAGVTGATAEWKDQTDRIKSNLPLVVGFVLVLAFGLMLFAFRSIVIAAKAIVLNLLSVARRVRRAGARLPARLRQRPPRLHVDERDRPGRPAPPLRDPVRALDGLPRVPPEPDPRGGGPGASTDEAVSHGIKTTAGVVTSAAIVMVAVFAVFATLSMLMFKQFGVGLAAAILIDATIIRGVLLPASMKLLGDWNWYVPSWLEWLPRFGLEDEAPAYGRARTARRLGRTSTPGSFAARGSRP